MNVQLRPMALLMVALFEVVGCQERGEPGRRSDPPGATRAAINAPPAFQLRDLNAVAANGASNPRSFTRVNDVLFFVADHAGGESLWRSDGTSAGTAVVKDFYAAGAEWLSPRLLVAVNGTLYFVANGLGVEQLWKSDGTAAGTVVVRSFPEGVPARTCSRSPPSERRSSSRRTTA